MSQILTLLRTFPPPPPFLTKTTTTRLRLDTIARCIAAATAAPCQHGSGVILGAWETRNTINMRLFNKPRTPKPLRRMGSMFSVRLIQRDHVKGVPSRKLDLSCAAGGVPPPAWPHVLLGHRLCRPSPSTPPPPPEAPPPTAPTAVAPATSPFSEEISSAAWQHPYHAKVPQRAATAAAAVTASSTTTTTNNYDRTHRT